MALTDRFSRNGGDTLALHLSSAKARLALPRIFRTSGLLWRILQPRLGVARHPPRSTGASPAYFFFVAAARLIGRAAEPSCFLVQDQGEKPRRRPIVRVVGGRFDLFRKGPVPTAEVIGKESLVSVGADGGTIAVASEPRVRLLVDQHARELEFGNHAVGLDGR